MQEDCHATRTLVCTTVELDVTHLDILHVIHSHEIMNILLEILDSLKSCLHLDINISHHISVHLAHLSLLTRVQWAGNNGLC